MSDRKYRQSGYQDDGPPGSGGEGRPGREPREGPKGRGLGTPTQSVSKCSRCGARLGQVQSSGDTCKNCGNDLHTCTNCRHFDTSAPMECRQSVEVRIAAKAKNNDCGLFEPRLVQEFVSDAGPGASHRDAKAAFDDLFDF